MNCVVQYVGVEVSSGKESWELTVFGVICEFRQLDFCRFEMKDFRYLYDTERGIKRV